MITANRPIMEARSINTDYKSLAQTILADSILDYYMREKGLENCIYRAVEMAVVMGSGYIKLDWNATAGDVYDVDENTGQFNYEGEIEFSTPSVLDVVVDGTKETWDNNDWILVRSFQNRFDLIAKYPEHADKLKACISKAQSSVYRLAVFSNDDTDNIAVYEFFHKRTEAMSDGRYILFAGDDIVLIDANMPYRVLPVFRMAPAEIPGTPYGYSPMFDCFPIQECINSVYSGIMTNNNAFMVQNLWVPRGADLAINTLNGAMNIIEGNTKPEPLQLTASAPETYKLLETLIQAMETISGVNSVTRGNPEASLKSGTALALVQSMSLQFISGLQQSYVRLIEDVGTALIQILKDFSNTPKMMALIGRNNKSYLAEFTGEKISDINRVIVDIGNPLSRCLAKNTPVLMYDGTIKMVQDIKIGQLVMGPDSGPRTVKNVNIGEETMYEVTSKDIHRGIKYGCNESHILTLKYCSDDYRYDAKQGDILDITIRDYLKLTDRQKRLLQGFTTGVEFDKKNLSVPAYILGAWLGDGTSKGTCLTSMDKELVDEWYNYAHSIGMQVRVEENKQPNKSKNYHITSGESHGKSDRNPFMNELRGMELINNKHIPFHYLTSNSEDRLNLLAGLLDTDGYRLDETFIFTQKNEKLTNDVIYLAKSLGFRVTSKKFKSNSSKLVGELDSECFKVTIGGDTWRIPTRLPRKHVKEKEKVRNPLNYGINVECKGMGTYYGFTLEEEPHFLLGDFTVTHNTVAGRVQMAEQLLQMKLLTNPQQYFQVINTGRLDSTFEGELDELMNIKSENEALLEGHQVQAVYLDQHSQHIKEHRAVLADPNLRKDPTLVKTALDHIQQHVDLLRTTDPGVLGIIGEQALPPAPPPGAPQLPPGGPVPPAGPPQGGRPPLPQGANGQPPVHAIQNSKNPGIMQPMQGQVNPSQQVSNGIKSGMIPQAAKPARPFQNLPTNPADLLPK
jgi:hypothetical protein